MRGTSQTEEQSITSGRGKWSLAGVPHSGWTCVDVEDLGEPLAECEMCESQTIRYIHHMEHPNYADVLGVGCVCAGHLEQDASAARGREAAMQSRAGKRMRWLTRRWKTSAKGYPWIRVDGFRVTVYPRGVGWAATVVRGEDPPIHSRRNFNSLDQAKLAAFDQITGILAGKP
jgi:hypothetical protein